MSVVLDTAHQLVVLYDTHRPHILADGNFPDPPAKKLPPKAQNGVDSLLGYMKTGIYVAAVAAGLFIVIGMILGARGRSNYAKDAVMHFPWVFGGVILAGTLTALLDSFS